MSAEGPVTAADAWEDDTVGGTAAAPPNDPQALREEIERTRERLGETVEALAAKADVKAQAQQKLGQVTGRLKTGADQARQQATATAGQLKQQATATAGQVRQQATAVAGQARQRAAATSASLSKAAPEPVQRAASNAAVTARQNRVPLAAAAAAGAAVLVLLLIVRRAAEIMKLLYKPLGLLAGIVGGMIAQALFKQAWKVSTGEDEAPQATDARRGWREVLLAAALQGAIFAVVRAALDRATAQGTGQLTGDADASAPAGT